MLFICNHRYADYYYFSFTYTYKFDGLLQKYTKDFISTKCGLTRVVFV